MKILMVGTFDSKEKEYEFLRSELIRRNAEVLCADFGIMGDCKAFPVDISAETVAAAGGASLSALRSGKDRARAIEAMHRGLPVVVKRLFDEGKFDGIIGMGGGNGTSVCAAAMRALPIGVPKVCVTTVASGDTRHIVGISDLVLIPSVADICGLNRFTRAVLSRAAGAVVGMAQYAPPIQAEAERPIVFISMFGNSAACVSRCARLLDDAGYDSIVFHAIGTGGSAMEALTAEGCCAAVLDITTTEWADEIAGGTRSAGPARLDAPGSLGIPHVIAPGCMDMVNFGPMDSVPPSLRDGGRRFYASNSLTTLMRTTPEENRKAGGIFAQKANDAQGPVGFVLPTKGFSFVGSEGHPFYDPIADRALIDAVVEHVRPGIPVEIVDANINDPVFADRAVDMLLGFLKAD